MMPQSWVGRTIGDRYQIDSLLGQGGMSAVYRATDPNLRRMVAIKLIQRLLNQAMLLFIRNNNQRIALFAWQHIG